MCHFWWHICVIGAANTLSICPLWYSFLTQHESILAVTLQRRQMGCPCQVCSVLGMGQGTKLDDHSSDLQVLPSCPFSCGSGLKWLGAHLPWDQNRLFNHEAGGLQGSWGWASGYLCVTAHAEMNTCFIINPWKSVMWHGEIEVSALLRSSSSLGACFPRITSAGDHTAAPRNFLPKTGCFSNIRVNSSKALAQL